MEYIKRGCSHIRLIFGKSVATKFEFFLFQSYWWQASLTMLLKLWRREKIASIIINWFYGFGNIWHFRTSECMVFSDSSWKRSHKKSQLGFSYKHWILMLPKRKGWPALIHVSYWKHLFSNGWNAKVDRWIPFRHLSLLSYYYYTLT